MKLRTPILAILALMLALPALSAPVQPAPHVTLRQATVAPTTLQLVVLVMPYTDASGNVYPASVWFPAMVTQDILDKQGSVDWRGYKDAAAMIAGKASIASHLTHVDTPTFLAGSQQPPQGSTQAQNTAALAIGFGMSVLDTPVLDASGKPTVDASGKPVLGAFFTGATQTIVNVPVGS